jgi:hypothetical protein
LIENPFFPRQQISFGRKRVEQWLAVRQERALAILPEARGLSEQSSGKIKQPVVLPGLQGKAKCGKEASLLT